MTSRPPFGREHVQEFCDWDPNWFAVAPLPLFRRWPTNIANERPRTALSFLQFHHTAIERLSREWK
jgi:hypothetical protein